MDYLLKEKWNTWEIWGKFEKNLGKIWEKLEYLGKIGILGKKFGKNWNT
jgi:hypothetical protein